MNDRQKKFVREYSLCGNATEAAKRAGYSEKTAYSQGHDLLKNPEIKKALAKLDAKAERETIATHAEACERMTQILREGDDQVAIKAADRLAKMRGWDQPTKVAPTDVTGTESYRPAPLTPQEAIDIYAEALRRALPHG